MNTMLTWNYKMHSFSATYAQKGATFYVFVHLAQFLIAKTEKFKSDN